MIVSEIPENIGTKRQRFGMMTAVCMGAFMSHFTAGIVNVSLPQFMNYFQTDYGKIGWITIGYLLVITALLPVMGKLGDRYGFRLIHNLGYVIFTINRFYISCIFTEFVLSANS